MGVNLYVNLDTLQLIEGPGFRNPITALRFKRGDAARLEVTFLYGGTSPASIGNPDTLELHFGIKPRNRYDAGYLVHTAAWTLPTPDATNPVYQCSPSFNTVELDAEFGIGSSAGTESAEITLMGEITWREGAGQPTSTRTFLVVVENDVNRGTEGVPLSAEPAYPAPANIITISTLGNRAVRFDVAQSLSDAQKAQARANIGAGTGEGTGGPVAWGDVTNKPSTFTPSNHSQSIGSIDGLDAELLKRPFVNYGYNPGTITGGDVGHDLFLIDGQRVWLHRGYDYTNREFLTINQTYPVAGSIPTILTTGDATLLTPGSEGQVLSIVSGQPAWVDATPTPITSGTIGRVDVFMGTPTLNPSPWVIPSFPAQTKAIQINVTINAEYDYVGVGFGLVEMDLTASVISQALADAAYGLVIVDSFGYLSLEGRSGGIYHLKPGDVYSFLLKVSDGSLPSYPGAALYDFNSPFVGYFPSDISADLTYEIVDRPS